MNFEQIERIVKLIENSELMSFSYKDEEVEISMDKKNNIPVISTGVSSSVGSFAAPDLPESPEAKHQDEALFITSPIVGTYYSAAGPDIPAYVKVGDRIKSGATVCIIEAMKLMNEIQCDWDCEIESILVSNEQKVEYGQPLFKVKRL